MNDPALYPVLAGALSAVVVFYGCWVLAQRRRYRLRRTVLRSRLYG